MAQRSSTTRSTSGIGFIDGQQVLAIQDGGFSFANTEFIANMGCSRYPWFRANSSSELTGSFTCQVSSPLLMSIATGGDVVATNGYSIVQDEAPSTSATGVTLANTDLHTSTDRNNLTMGEITATFKGSAGDTVYNQVATIPTSSGEFQVNDASAGTLRIHTDDIGNTLNFTYMYKVSAQSYFELQKDDSPSFITLGLNFCVYDLDTGAEGKRTLWIPKAKINGVDHSASVGATEPQTWNFTWGAVPDSNNVVARIY